MGELTGGVRRGTGQWSEVRLWTSLLDEKNHPAWELLALYAQRWEQEIFYRELKVDMRSSELVQSHTPVTAAQEIAALILGYAMLVDERVKAAKVGKVVRRTLRHIAEMAIAKRRARSCPRKLRQPVSSWPRLRKNTCKSGPSEYQLSAIRA